MKKNRILAVLVALASFSAIAAQLGSLSDEQILSLDQAGCLTWFDQNGGQLSVAQVEELRNNGTLIELLRAGTLSFKDEFRRKEPFVSVPTPKILVESEDDQASRDLAASFEFLGFGASYNAEGGGPFRAGSCTLVRNNAQDGAWILTSHHATTVNADTESETRAVLKYGFAVNCYEGLDEAITADHARIFYHPIQDILSSLKALCMTPAEA